MTLNQKLASLLLSSIFGFAAIAAPALAENAPTVPLSVEEIKAKRKEARENVMVPSLQGVRGIAYRVVGYKDFDPLETQLGGILKETNVPLFVATKLKPGDEPVDAILQITFFKTSSHTIAELRVNQWVSLLRDPKSKINAVTYSDKVFLSSHNPKEAVEELGKEFVADFLKANANTSAKASKKASREASDNKESKKQKKSKK